MFFAGALLPREARRVRGCDKYTRYLRYEAEREHELVSQFLAQGDGGTIFRDKSRP